MKKLRESHKVMALVLVLTLVVFAAAACGVPDEDEFEELDDPGDDFGLEDEASQELAVYNLEQPEINIVG